MTDASGDRPGRTGEVQSVARALELLELVARAEEIGVSELAREAGLAVSTAHSLVRTLAGRHYLVGTAGRYRLGPAASLLTAGWDPAAALTDSVGPALDSLAERTDLATTGTVLVGREARVIGFAAAPGPITATPSHLTWTSPLHLATGRVLVALTREAEWAEIVDREGTVEPSWSQRRWLNELRNVRRTGVALKRTKEARAVSGLAVPVWARGGTVVASIGCSAPNFLFADLARSSTLEALWDTSRGLSSQLGCDELPLVPDLQLFATSGTTRTRRPTPQRIRTPGAGRP